MFCHLALQGRPSPEHEPEVDLTSSQSCLSSSAPLTEESRREGWGGGDTDPQSETWAKLILFRASLHMSPQDRFFYFLFFSFSYKERRVRRSQAGEKWYWLGQVDAFS